MPETCCYMVIDKVIHSIFSPFVHCEKLQDVGYPHHDFLHRPVCLSRIHIRRKLRQMSNLPLPDSVFHKNLLLVLLIVVVCAFNFSSPLG
jgi:hypothetical protein